MEEPDEVVHDDEDAGGDEGVGGEGDERPRVREVLEVYDVAEDGECDLVCGERIRDCEQDVYCDDGLATKPVSAQHIQYASQVPCNQGGAYLWTRKCSSIHVHRWISFRESLRVWCALRSVLKARAGH